MSYLSRLPVDVIGAPALRQISQEAGLNSIGTFSDRAADASGVPGYFCCSLIEHMAGQMGIGCAFHEGFEELDVCTMGPWAFLRDDVEIEDLVHAFGRSRFGAVGIRNFEKCFYTFIEIHQYSLPSALF
jgi:hypothetical protein